MSRFGKYTTLIYLLLAVAVLEFIGLASLLLLDSTPRQPDTAPEEAAAAPEAPSDVLPEPLVVEKEAPAGEKTAAEILANTQLISHGMGGIDGEVALNCLESFQEQYKQGMRVFEVDLRLTSDNQVVLRHDWRAGWQWGVSETNIPTLEDFLRKPLLRKYTPLSFRDLLRLMEKYPDICIITDTKFSDAEIVKMQFEAMLQDAEELGLSYLFDRMIIQIYNPVMYQVVDTLHHFRFYIYTLYNSGFLQTEEAFREKADFCVENGIMGITLWSGWWRGSYAAIAGRYGLPLYVHTLNDADQVQLLLDSGAAAVYTDELTPSRLEKAQSAAPKQDKPTTEEGE